MADETEVLLTGATGFVGGYLHPALVSAGYRVRCASRRPEEARRRFPGRKWVELDVTRPETLAPALDGCRSAFFLMHGMAGGSGYPERERQAAELFAREAGRAGLERIVYLGGVLPRGGRPSRHLSSRARCGAVLRQGPVSTIELRAAMIIGVGSVSWSMVRDLAVRLPAMVLPRWLRNSSHPIAIDDVIYGLLEALALPGSETTWFEIPGPERITHRRMLERTAARIGHHRPMINVPVLSPKLSSYWIAMVTRVDLELAAELVEGLRYDLDPSGVSLWSRLGGHELVPLDQAIDQALADERRPGTPPWSAEARMVDIGHGFRYRVAG